MPSAGYRSSSRFVKLLLIVCAALFTIFLSVHMRDILPFNPHTIGNSLSSFVSQESASKCVCPVTGSSESTSGGRRYFTLGFGGSSCCGMGNQIFEFVVAIGLARRLNRTLYLRADDSGGVVAKLKYLDKVFPNLLDYVTLRLEKEGEAIKHFEITEEKCCVYGNVSVLEGASAEQTIQVDSRFLQSFRYFENIASEIPTTILKFSQAVEKDADEKLFGSDVMKSTNHRLCVHTRRGDFVGSRWIIWSTDVFTAGASALLAEEVIKTGKNVSVLLFSNDHEWLKKVKGTAFGQRPPFSVFIPNYANFAAADIAFARKHCHSVLLTAPMSTFGWWMGYLAWKANNASVYYREEYSQPNGLDKEINRDDFFPPEWKTVKLPSREPELDEPFRTVATSTLTTKPG